MNVEKCQVLVPVYRALNEKEKLRVAHNISMLEDRPAALIGPVGERQLIEELCSELSRETGREITSALFDNHHFQSVSGYNALLMSRAFFERFAGYEYILICQHDALVLSNALAPWLETGYAFVGAPHVAGFHNPERPLKFLKSLNGGFSLRRVEDVLKVIDNVVLQRRNFVLRVMESTGALAARNAIFASKRLPIIPLRKSLNEDMFWSETAPSMFEWYRTPPPEEAARFAFEVCPVDLFEITGHRLPFGCHAFEKYDREFWITHLPKDLIPLI